jgi:hypothetical protein
MTKLTVAFFLRNFANVPNNDFSFFCDDVKPGVVLSYEVLLSYYQCSVPPVLFECRILP